MTSATRQSITNCFMLLMVLTAASLGGCGKSVEQQAAENAKWKKIETDAAAAAQAELDADSKRFREAATKPASRQSPVKLSAAAELQLIDSLTAHLKRRLKDADSARFGGKRLTYHSNNAGETSYLLCGKVNAKNSYGGYGGFTYFGVLSKGSSDADPLVLMRDDEIGKIMLDGWIANGWC